MKYIPTEKDFEYSYFNNKLTSNYQSYQSKNIYPAFFQFSKSISKLININRVLDIGCAKGYLVLAFKKINIDAYGVDISDYAIKHSPKLIKKNLIKINVEKQKLPFPNNYFDLVISTEVIEHISSHHFLLNEIKRVLKPNGRIFFTTPSHNLKNKMGIPIDKTHVSVFPRKKWLKLFKKHSLININDFTYFKLLLIFAYSMSKSPPMSYFGKLFDKFGWLGHKLRITLLTMDVITHYYTDIFFLTKS